MSQDVRHREYRMKSATPIYTHCKPERSVLAVKIRPFRWVKYSSIFGSILALNRGKYSPITYGWFGSKGWNESQPGWNRLLMGHGSWRGWIRLWPAGLNWHFGAKTDLFNFQCTTWKWVGSVIPENERTSFVTEWNFWCGSKLRKQIFLSRQTDPYATTEAGKLRTWTRRTKSAKKPIQSNCNWIGWFLIYMRKYLIG